MANAINGNTIFIDTTGTISLTGKRFNVTCVTVTATSANAILALQDTDGVTDTDKIEFRVATSGETKPFDLGRFPVFFPNGIKIKTMTNGNATIVYTRQSDKK